MTAKEAYKDIELLLREVEGTERIKLQKMIIRDLETFEQAVKRVYAYLDSKPKYKVYKKLKKRPQRPQRPENQRGL